MVTHIDSGKTQETLSSSRLRLAVTSALFAALTFVGTFIIKVPTVTNGYIHPGDGFVILSGVFLGPLWGGLAAGFGSMLSDLIGGYITYVPATFIIKALVAVIAAGITALIQKLIQNKKNVVPVIAGGVIGEIFMVVGYFVFETFLAVFTTGNGFTATSFNAALAASAAGIPANIIQGVFGIIISAVLYPILRPLVNKAFN